MAATPQHFISAKLIAASIQALRVVVVPSAFLLCTSISHNVARGYVECGYVKIASLTGPLYLKGRNITPYYAKCRSSPFHRRSRFGVL